MENKKRDIWSDREIREMLSIINEKHIMQLIDGKTKRNKNIFVDIATEMKKKNISKNDVQIRNKFKSLKSDFYKTKRSNNKSGAKRQTSEHYELLDDIFGHRPALEAVGMDTIEMDRVDETETMDEAEFLDDAEVDVSVLPSQDEEPTASTSQGFRRIKKNSYQKVVETFTKEWKDSQEEMLKKMRMQDEKLVDYQTKKQEDMMGGIMEINRKAMKEMLDEDRRETSKMLQHFLNASQPVHPYMYQPPNFYTRELPLATTVELPKTSPPDNENGF